MDPVFLAHRHGQHQVLDPEELGREVEGSLVGASHDPGLITDLLRQDASGLQDLLLRERGLGIGHREISDLVERPDQRLVSDRRGVIAIGNLGAAGLRVAAGAVLQQDHVVPVLAPRIEHGLCQQLAVAEGLGEGTPECLRCGQEVVQVDGNPVRSPHLYRRGDTLDRVHVVLPSLDLSSRWRS